MKEDNEEVTEKVIYEEKNEKIILKIIWTQN